MASDHASCEFKDTELGHFCGSLLLRKKFRISEQQAGRAGVLRFGTLVDSDEMFLNGVKIGETGYQYPPRRYPVPEGLLREGKYAGNPPHLPLWKWKGDAG